MIDLKKFMASAVQEGIAAGIEGEHTLHEGPSELDVEVLVTRTSPLVTTVKVVSAGAPVLHFEVRFKEVL